MTAYQDFVRSEMSGFHGTRQQMNLKMKEIGARWKAHKSGAGMSKIHGSGLQSDIKNALANVDLNQLKHIDFSKTKQYITGSGIKKRSRNISGKGLKVVKRIGNVLRRKHNIVKNSARSIVENKHVDSNIESGAGVFLPF